MNAFTRFGNTMTSAMIRLGISPAGMRLLMVRDHKNRLPRTTPVNVIEHQGRRWRWPRNGSNATQQRVN